uniref:Uncharacterized protein MANES_11G073900 n=1 Tax=Rhizophora mucronata TaxID=61149 RepID=A0A2P2JZU1_RHIMU
MPFSPETQMQAQAQIIMPSPGQCRRLLPDPFILKPFRHRNGHQIGPTERKGRHGTRSNICPQRADSERPKQEGGLETRHGIRRGRQVHSAGEGAATEGIAEA